MVPPNEITAMLGRGVGTLGFLTSKREAGVHHALVCTSLKALMNVRQEAEEGSSKYLLSMEERARML
jgi:hypothetical protein